MSSSVVAAEKVIKKVFDDTEDKKDSKIIPKDFYWDQVAFYLVSIILGLSFLDISVEFFRGSHVQCFPPTDIPVDRDHFAYLNNHCYGSLPHSQYYLVFLLGSALALLGPHYLWNAYFSKHIDFFFDLLKKLDRLRDPNTGEYSQQNFAYIKKLEERFSDLKTSKIFIFYVMKLLLQLVVCIGMILINAFYFESEDFEADFNCTVGLGNIIWPYNEHIPCVYNSLRLLEFLWGITFVLLACSSLVLLYGVYWCCVNHGDELGAVDIAKFCFDSFLQPENHPSLPSTSSHLVRLIAKKCLRNTSDFSVTVSSRIKSDLDFLLMKLFFADSGHGQVFKDILINKELKTLVEHNQEMIHVILRIHADMLKRKITGAKPLDHTQELRDMFFEAGITMAADPSKKIEAQIYSQMQSELSIKEDDWSAPEMRDVLYRFFQFVKQNKTAIDITFEGKYGYSLVLCLAFHKVITVFYDRYYRNPEDKVCKEKFPAGYDIVTYPDNIYSCTADYTTKADQCLADIFGTNKQKPKREVDLIMVGPITDRSKLVSATFLINKVHERDCFDKHATIIVVRPLRIGNNNVINDFHKYTPSKRLFQENQDKVFKFLMNRERKKEAVVYKVEGNSFIRILADGRNDDKPDVFGIQVTCVNVKCIFEICVYRYQGSMDTIDV